MLLVIVHASTFYVRFSTNTGAIYKGGVRNSPDFYSLKDFECLPDPQYNQSPGRRLPKLYWDNGKENGSYYSILGGYNSLGLLG